MKDRLSKGILTLTSENSDEADFIVGAFYRSLFDLNPNSRLTSQFGIEVKYSNGFKTTQVKVDVSNRSSRFYVSECVKRLPDKVKVSGKLKERLSK